MAWISSTITVRTLASARRPLSDVMRMNSDSGVVTSTCGGCLTAWRRPLALVSPVRTAVRMRGGSSPCAEASAASSAMGTSRFFWTSLERALSGET